MSTAAKIGDPATAYEIAAGPVLAIVWPTGFAATVVPLAWPLTLAALLTTAKSETNITVAKTMLIVVRLWFIRFTFLDVFIHAIHISTPENIREDCRWRSIEAREAARCSRSTRRSRWC